MQKFTEFNLDPRILKALTDLNYETTTEIQSKSLPLILAGKDLAGLSQTGTGKTAAFLIPLLQRILDTESGVGFSQWQRPNFILVVVPTRELAEQVMENFQNIAKYTELQACAVYGGTGYEKQRELVAKGVQLIAATPGRLIDLYKEHVIDLKQVRAVVFDEADRMFDMGFKDDMKFLLSRIPRERQFLVFSATLNFDVLNTAYQFGAEPVEISISRDQAKAENVADSIFHVGQEDKPAYLLSILEKHNPKQAIVFSNFKNQVERIAKFLVLNGIDAEAISSLLTQTSRSKVITKFKTPQEKMCVLVATDVAARGLDIKGVDLVVNFELPMDAESYVHRIGRTGRAGSTGQAFSLVSDRDVDSLSRVEDYLKNKLTTSWLEDSEIKKEFVAFPSESDFYEPRGSQRRGPSQAPHRGKPQGSGGRREDRPGSRASGPRAHSEGRREGPRKASAGPRSSSSPAAATSSQSSHKDASRGPQNQKSSSGYRQERSAHGGHRPPRKNAASNGATASRRPLPVSRAAKSPGFIGWMKSIFSKIVGQKSK